MDENIAGISNKDSWFEIKMYFFPGSIFPIPEMSNLTPQINKITGDHILRATKDAQSFLKVTVMKIKANKAQKMVQADTKKY